MFAQDRGDIKDDRFGKPNAPKTHYDSRGFWAPNQAIPVCEVQAGISRIFEEERWPAQTASFLGDHVPPGRQPGQGQAGAAG